MRAGETSERERRARVVSSFLLAGPIVEGRVPREADDGSQLSSPLAPRHFEPPPTAQDGQRRTMVGVLKQESLYLV